MIVSIVRFRSGLSERDVQAQFEERAREYAQVQGLREKIYVRFRESGEWGAVYVWDSEQSLARFRESTLARSIPSAYAVDGGAHSELADVRLVVEGRVTGAGA